MTRSDILRLIDSLEGLTLAIREGGLVVQQEDLLADWTLIAGEQPRPELGDSGPFQAEEGPPPVPASLLFLSRQLHSAKSNGEVRIRRAYNAGFWARIAVETCTSFQGPEALPLKNAHFLILRARGLSRPVRVLKWEEADRLVRSDPEAIHLGFPSLIEVQSFCCGAGVSVPPLYGWRNSASSSAQRAISSSGHALETLAVAVIARQGGFLMCVPEDTVQSSLFSAAIEHVGELRSLGPGDVFSTPVVEEVDEALAPMGFDVQVQVFDVSDAFLSLLREFDPGVDNLSDIKTFSETAPHCFPEAETLVDRVHGWMRVLTSEDGGLFYSAQDDLGPSPKAKASAKDAPTKKAAAPKRVTNAAIVEQLNALAMQVQVMMSRQDQMEASAPSKASTAKDASGVQMVSSRVLPSVSAGLAGLPVEMQGLSTVKKAASLVGPPP